MVARSIVIEGKSREGLAYSFERDGMNGAMVSTGTVRLAYRSSFGGMSQVGGTNWAVVFAHNLNYGLALKNGSVYLHFSILDP